MIDRLQKKILLSLWKQYYLLIDSEEEKLSYCRRMKVCAKHTYVAITYDVCPDDKVIGGIKSFPPFVTHQ